MRGALANELLQYSKTNSQRKSDPKVAFFVSGGTGVRSVCVLLCPNKYFLSIKTST